MSKNFNVTIFTDGSCIPNPGNGGYAAILKWGSKYLEITGGEICATNNRMELIAVLKALSALRKPCNVTLYTDSEYVLKAIGGIRKPNFNTDLFGRLSSLLKMHKVKAIWIRGHSNLSENDRCDFLAKREARKLNNI